MRTRWFIRWFIQHYILFWHFDRIFLVEAVIYIGNCLRLFLSFASCLTLLSLPDHSFFIEFDRRLFFNLLLWLCYDWLFELKHWMVRIEWWFQLGLIINRNLIACHVFLWWKSRLSSVVVLYPLNVFFTSLRRMLLFSFIVFLIWIPANVVIIVVLGCRWSITTNR